MQQTTLPIEPRLDWATITVQAVANGVVGGVGGYVGAMLHQGATKPPISRPSAPTVILPPGVDRK
jgi:hypothetical protein